MKLLMALGLVVFAIPVLNLSCKSRDSLLKSDLEKTTFAGVQRFSTPEYLKSRRPVLIYYWNNTNVSRNFEFLEHARKTFLEWSQTQDAGFNLTAKNLAFLFSALTESEAYKNASPQDKLRFEFILNKHREEVNKFTGQWTLGTIPPDIRFKFIGLIEQWRAVWHSWDQTNLKPNGAVSSYFFNLEAENNRSQFGYFFQDGFKDTNVKTVALASDKSKRYPFIDHPLATEEGLKRALEIVRKNYPPETHRYYLILKSHGSEDTPLAVKYPLDLRKVDRELLAETLLEYYRPVLEVDGGGRVKVNQGVEAISSESPELRNVIGEPEENSLDGPLSKRIEGPTGKSLDSPLSKRIEGPTGKSLDSPLSKRIEGPTGKGLLSPLNSSNDLLSKFNSFFVSDRAYLEESLVSKTNVMQIISRDFGPMDFPIVFFESCNSSIGQEKFRIITEMLQIRNIGEVVGSSGGLLYEDNIKMLQVNPSAFNDPFWALYSQIRIQSSDKK